MLLQSAKRQRHGELLTKIPSNKEQSSCAPWSTSYCTYIVGNQNLLSSTTVDCLYGIDCGPQKALEQQMLLIATQRSVTIPFPSIMLPDVPHREHSTLSNTSIVVVVGLSIIFHLQCGVGRLDTKMDCLYDTGYGYSESLVVLCEFVSDESSVGRDRYAHHTYLCAALCVGAE